MKESADLFARADYEASLAKEYFISVSKNTQSETIKEQFNLISEKLDEALSLSGKLKETASYLPDILGRDGRKTYLVLFQNPMEIRSTGGWIGGYALVGLEQGQIRQLEVDDIYNADGRLTTEGKTISPPSDMASALDIKSWSLSLSNWSPDFPTASKDMEYLAQQELQAENIDGVIAVDLYLVKDLLEILGGVDVGGKEGLVSADNLFDKTIQVRSGFAPGSSQKSAFIGRLGGAVAEGMLSLSKDKWPIVVEKLGENLDEKHILISLDNLKGNRDVLENNWSGALIANSISHIGLRNVMGESGLQVENSEDSSSKLRECDVYLYSVDWNWGGNKVNKYIEKSEYVDISMVAYQDRFDVVGTFAIKYKNTSASPSFPGGEYENYLRVYLPKSSYSVSAQGLQTSGKLAKRYGLTEYSGFVNVPFASSEIVKIKWRNPIYFENNISSNGLTNSGNSVGSNGVSLSRDSGYDGANSSVSSANKSGERKENVIFCVQKQPGVDFMEIDMAVKIPN